MQNLIRRHPTAVLSTCAKKHRWINAYMKILTVYPSVLETVKQCSLTETREGYAKKYINSILALTFAVLLGVRSSL